MAEAIATNTTLKELEYALSSPALLSIPLNILPTLPASDTCLVCATACKATTWTKPPSSNSKELLAAASPCGSKLSPCAAAGSAGAPS